MSASTWQIFLMAGLVLNATVGLGYRIYRYSKGGARSDVIGQSILGALLLLTALGIVMGWGPATVIALGYGLVFGLVVMPLWTVAVLIPLRPRRLDYGFTIVYWSALGLIVVASIAA